ncbi:Beaten path Ic, partial [Operophtera brumata]
MKLYDVIPLPQIQGKPVIQQRILPSPVVSIEVPHGYPGRSTPFPGDENSNIIFSPWKAFGPFVDTIQEGELLPSQDTVVLPSPRHHESMDEDATDPMPTAETSKKLLPSQDTVVLPSPRHHESMDEDATDPMPTAETSTKASNRSWSSCQLLPSQDTIVLPSPRHHESMDEDATDPMPTAETSTKVASISQLSFMVRPDSFERGQLRLTCISSVHAVYSEQAELVINEERPQIAS